MTGPLSIVMLRSENNKHYPIACYMNPSCAEGCKIEFEDFIQGRDLILREDEIHLNGEIQEYPSFFPDSLRGKGSFIEPFVTVEVVHADLS